MGNIFQLGYYYSKKMKGAEFTDQEGKGNPYYMGCYGIGIDRTMATIVEKYHDDKGLIWPKQVAPFDVHLVELKTQNSKLKAKEIYERLEGAGIEVLWDDRDVAAGEKFAAADLIGIPVRLVISDKTKDKIEWKERTSEKTELLSVEEVIKKFHD